MNPAEALKYMKETGKPVVAEKLPHWANPATDDPNGEWVKHRYQCGQNDSILETYPVSPTTSTVIKVWTTDEWLNWWFNFCYNTNSAHHNVELLPYERA